MNSKRYPLLASILAGTRKAFADFEGPLFENASVEVKTKKNPEGRSLPDPTTAKLVLPNIQAVESERIPEKFQITVKREFEDEMAMAQTYAFTFQVSDMKFEPLANGQVRPRFNAELKEYKHG